MYRVIGLSDSHNSSVKRYSFGEPALERKMKIAVLFEKAKISSGKLNTAQIMKLRTVFCIEHILGDIDLKAALYNYLDKFCKPRITFSFKPQNHRPQHVGSPLLLSETDYNKYSQNSGLNVPPVGATVHSRAPQTRFQQSHMCHERMRST